MVPTELTEERTLGLSIHLIRVPYVTSYIYTRGFYLFLPAALLARNLETWKYGNLEILENNAGNSVRPFPSILEAKLATGGGVPPKKKI